MDTEVPDTGEELDDDIALFHMTVRHGADYAKRYVDGVALAELTEAEEIERLRRLSSDLRPPSPAEIVPFPRASVRRNEE